MKITVAGDAVIITSELKFSDIQTLEKFRPNALISYGGDDGKDPMFRIATSTGYGRVDKYGIVFNGEARDGSGKAVVTVSMSIPNENQSEDEIKSALVNAIGEQLGYLVQMEESIPTVVSDVVSRHDTIKDAITII
jgi:hypothetical protein